MIVDSTQQIKRNFNVYLNRTEKIHQTIFFIFFQNIYRITNGTDVTINAKMKTATCIDQHTIIQNSLVNYGS